MQNVNQNGNSKNIFLKRQKEGQVWWLKPVILAKQEANTGRITVQGQPWEKPKRPLPHLNPR
jgi:hypothetical protein